MADQSMMSLFDSDPSSFLDELTGPDLSVPMQGMGSGLGMGDGSDMGMQQAMNPPGGPGMGMPMDPMQQQQQQPQQHPQQQHPGYSQMGQMQGQGMPSHPRGPGPYENPNQMYPDSAKLLHMASNASAMQVGGQGHGMMSPSHQAPQQQYSSAPGHMQQQPSSGYPGYPMRGGQRMTPPRMTNPQQMGMNQPNMWNRAPGTPQQSMGGSPYPNRYPNVHPEYGMSGSPQTPSQPQHHGHYPGQQTTPPNGGYPSGPGAMGSPPPNPTQRLSHMGSPNPMMNVNRNHPQYHHSQQMVNQPNMGMGHMSNTPQSVRPGPGGFPDNSMKQQQQQHHPQQMGPGAPQMNHQNYPYPGPGGQQPGMIHRQPTDGDMSRFGGPNQNAQQYRPAYPGLAPHQQRPQASPRSTQVRTPTAHPPQQVQPPTQSQGNTSQSSLQQLEEMLPRPASNASSHSSFGPMSTGISGPNSSDSGSQPPMSAAGRQMPMSGQQMPAAPVSAPGPADPKSVMPAGMGQQMGGPVQPPVSSAPAPVSMAGPPMSSMAAQQQPPVTTASVPGKQQPMPTPTAAAPQQQTPMAAPVQQQQPPSFIGQQQPVSIPGQQPMSAPQRPVSAPGQQPPMSVAGPMSAPGQPPMSAPSQQSVSSSSGPPAGAPVSSAAAQQFAGPAQGMPAGAQQPTSAASAQQQTPSSGQQTPAVAGVPQRPPSGQAPIPPPAEQQKQQQPFAAGAPQMGPVSQAPSGHPSQQRPPSATGQPQMPMAGQPQAPSSAGQPMPSGQLPVSASGSQPPVPSSGQQQQQQPQPSFAGQQVSSTAGQSQMSSVAGQQQQMPGAGGQQMPVGGPQSSAGQPQMPMPGQQPHMGQYPGSAGGPQQNMSSVGQQQMSAAGPHQMSSGGQYQMAGGQHQMYRGPAPAPGQRPSGPVSNGMQGPMSSGSGGSGANGPMYDPMSGSGSYMSGPGGMGQGGPSINTNLPNRLNGPVSQMSPNRMNTMSPGFNQRMMNMNMEVNQLQQQISQLYSMQQAPDVQQKMLDLQERMRTVKAQQQQMIMQQRQQNMQQQQQQPQPMMRTGQPMRPGMNMHQMGPQMGGPPQQQQQQPPPHMAGGQQMPRHPMHPGMAPQMGGGGAHPHMAPHQMGQGMPPQQQQQHPGMPPYRQNGMPQSSSAGGGQLVQLIQQASPPMPATTTLPNSVGIPSQAAQLGAAPPPQGPPGRGAPLPGMEAQGPPGMMQAGAPVPLQPSGMPGTPQMPPSGDFPPHDTASPQISAQQEKANQIVADAIAQAQLAGEEGGEGTLGEAEEGSSTAKKKRKRKPKQPKDPNKKADAKETKATRTRTPRKKKGKEGESGDGDSLLDQLEGEDSNKAEDVADGKDSADGEAGDDGEKTDKPKKEKKKTAKTPKPKPPKKKKKLPPATFLKSKRKKKRGDSESDAGTPPGSPVDPGIEKRRSERNANKKKKYLDDLDLNLTDEEKPPEAELEGDGPVVKPQEAQTQVDEDTLIVEKILATRMGRRPKPKPEPEDEDTEVEDDSKPKQENPTENKTEDIKTDADKNEETEPAVQDEVAKKETEEAKEAAKEDNEASTHNETVSEAPSRKEESEEMKKDEGETNEDKETDAEKSKMEVPEGGQSLEEKPDEKSKMEVDEPEESKEPEEATKSTETQDEKEKELKTPQKEEKKEAQTPPKGEEMKTPQKEEKDTETKTPTKEEKEINVKEEIKKDLKFTPNKDDKQDDVEYEDVEEFYVKYKNFSYLHCEWRTQWELEFGDKRVAGKIKRFKMKKANQSEYFDQLDEEEFFNPDYVEVDRVLDATVVKDPVSGADVTHYLVKWQSLPYEDSTWELDKDVDNIKIEAYRKFKELPPEEDREPKDRPRGKLWTNMEEPLYYKNNNSLRDYQLEGVNWLTFCYYNRQNCILADEMGLGKTIQSITFLLEVWKYGIKGPYLIIVPLSTLGNWAREFENWTDMNAVVYHGSQASRSMLQEYELFYKDENGQRITSFYKFNALITTYETIISEIELLSEIEWKVCIIDEAHRLKNRGCKLLEGLKFLDLEHRVLLTGTPLQNNVDELFSLLNFLEPNQFKSSAEFLKEFGDLKSEGQVDKLQAILKPMMLRRLKEDVEKNLAAKEETIIEVELTNMQKKYYRAILERNFSFLAKGGTSALPSLMNTMMELRKCCNHPYLVNGAEENILEDMEVHKVTDPAQHEKALFNAMIQSCGKLVLIDKLLPKLKAGNHKVLIFSQMIRVLDILEDYLITKKYLYERLDGRIRGNIRQEAIDRFCRPDSDRFVFLLCTRAGGLGINLVAADTVIIYDSDWNPQNDLQAQARCHRIGQTKEVKVYRLITRNSYEREMFDKASLKLGLDKAVLKSMRNAEQPNSISQFSKKEVEDLLKKGAYGAVMDDDTEGDQFCEEDIDAILQRRTQVIQIQSEGKGSTFSKASFSVSTSRSDIDIDDPNFWQKWAKKAELDVDHLTKRNDLIIEMPRKRKQTRRFGGQEMDLDNISDLDSSDSEASEIAEEIGLATRGSKRLKGKAGTRSSRRGRRGGQDNDDDFSLAGELDDGGRYNRSDCFKVEKMLLVYGFGRWEDILAHGRFKKKLELSDVELIAKSVLLYSLKYYKGDEKIKSFIWDLVTNQVDMQKHDGLAAPVPRGRKGRRGKAEPKPVDTVELDYSILDFDPASVLPDDGYKKHLERHNNKVLLRVRLLYYLKQEVIGAQEEKVFLGKHYSEIDLPTPTHDGEVPVAWWDEDADKSLLIGTHKHGYEKYVLMRMDPSLCFLSRCGPPDQKAIMAEQQQDNDDDIKDDVDETGGAAEEDDDASTPAGASSGAAGTGGSRAASAEPDAGDSGGRLPFPSASDLNTRLRKIITGYQRSHKKELMRRAQEVKRMERRSSNRYQNLNERDLQRKLLLQSKWSRREEADFYRVASTFGVERDLSTGQYKWATFRSLAKLDKKFDETLTEYFLAFYHMCTTVCKKFKSREEALPPSSMTVEPITEERANRCVARIDLLNRIREKILWHPKLEERLQLCQPDSSMPDWWEPGAHDKELLIGAAKHGLAKTDFHIQHDPKLIFKEAINKYVKNQRPHYSLRHPSGLSATGATSEGEATPRSRLKERSPKKEKEGEALSLVKKDAKEKEKETEEKEVKSEDKDSLDLSKVKEESKEQEADTSTSDEKDTEQEGKEGEEKKVKTEEEKSEVKTEGENSEVKTEEEKSKSPVKMEVDKEEKDVKPEDVKEDDVKEEKKESEDGVKEEAKETTKVFGDEMKAAQDDDDEDTVEEGEAPPTLFKQDLVKSNEENDSESRLCPPDLDVMEPSSYIAGGGAGHQWPKDRVIFYRLEHVCHAVERGEWPAASARRYAHAIKDDMSDSRCSTPLPSTPGGGATPRPDDHLSTPEGGSTPQGDGRRRRKRRRKDEFETDRARIRDLLGSQSEADSESNISSFRDSLLNGSGDYSPLRSSEGSPLRFDGMEQYTQLRKKRGRKRKIDKLLEAAAAAAAQQQAAQQAQLQAAELLKAQHDLLKASASKHRYSPPSASAPPHASTSRSESGSPRVSGLDEADDTPSRRDIDKWFDLHTNYAPPQPAAPDHDGDPAERDPGAFDPHPRKKKKLDPNKLDLQNLTGEENVSVVHRDTGKKITGAKAPPLKYLSKWLEQNPGFDVEGKWAHIVLSKGNLPEKLKSRVLQPSGRGRRSAASSASSSATSATPTLTASSLSQAQASSLAAAYGYPGMGGMSPSNLMAAYSKMPMSALSFSGMPGMSLAGLAATNPMYASMYASMMPGLFGGMPGELEEMEAAQLAAAEGKEPGEVKGGAEKSPGTKEKKREKSDKHHSPSKSRSSTSSTSPTSSAAASVASSLHSAFPYMYNPMMFNPLYAQSLGASFTLPSGIPTSFASLAHAHMMNGVGDSDNEEERKPSSSSKKSSSSSSAATASLAQDVAEDLSVRKSSGRSRHERSSGGAHDLSVRKRPLEGEGVEDLTMHKRFAGERSPQDLSVKKSHHHHHESPEKSKPVELNIPKPPMHHQQKPQKRSKGLDSIVSSLSKKKGIDSLADALSKKAEKKLSPGKEASTSDSSRKESEES